MIVKTFFLADLFSLKVSTLMFQCSLLKHFFKGKKQKKNLFCSNLFTESKENCLESFSPLLASNILLNCRGGNHFRQHVHRIAFTPHPHPLKTSNRLLYCKPKNEKAIFPRAFCVLFACFTRAFLLLSTCFLRAFRMLLLASTCFCVLLHALAHFLSFYHTFSNFLSC